MSRYVSRSQFARIAGVSPAAVTKACKSSLAPALRRDRIDQDHEAAVAYVAKHNVGAAPVAHVDRAAVSAANKAGINERAARQTDEPEIIESDDGQRTADSRTNGHSLRTETGVIHDETDLGAYADLSIRELVRRFGTERVFKDWLEALKKIEDVVEKRISNQELRKHLVSRDLVATHVFGAIEASNRRLLTDCPKTITARLYAAARSDVPIEQAEETAREIIGASLRTVREAAVRILEPKD